MPDYRCVCGSYLSSALAAKRHRRWHDERWAAFLAGDLGPGARSHREVGRERSDGQSPHQVAGGTSAPPGERNLSAGNAMKSAPGGGDGRRCQALRRCPAWPATQRHPAHVRIQVWVIL